MNVRRAALAFVRWLASPAMRISFGLVSLTVTLLLLAELFTGYPADRGEAAQRHHAQVSALVGRQVAGVLRGQEGDAAAAHKVLAESMQREPVLRAVRVVDQAGQTLASTAGHESWWKLGPQDASTLTNVRVPLIARGTSWGEVQLVFHPVWPQTLAGWLRDPLVRWLAFIAGVGLLAFALYLRRMLRHLDPNAAVPERVRDAFDTLTEAVLVLDAQGHIMLANRAFCALRGDDAEALTGADVRRLEWLVQALGKAEPGSEPAWQRAVAQRQSILNIALSIDALDGRRELVMNCAPIMDGRRTRGCLATFSDVTELHERTERLRVAMDELRDSQEEIERKNEELTVLATRDALSGLFNRRSLMQQAEQHFQQARAAGTTICCIMCDIDHFKSINDKFGHGGGDLVIQRAAKALQDGLRPGDIAGRYGGEEFCVMLPGASEGEAMGVAERMRADIEAHLGAALRDHPGVRVTMSFGVARIGPGVADHAALIDLADQALYHSKKNGRNRVTAWQPQAAESAGAQ